MDLLSGRLNGQREFDVILNLFKKVKKTTIIPRHLQLSSILLNYGLVDKY